MCTDRCAHTLSESMRLQCDPAELQNSLTQHNQLAQEMKSNPLKTPAIIGRKLLIITGSSGSGVHAVSALLGEQLRTHQEMENRLVDSVEINILDAMVMNDDYGIITNVEFLNNIEALIMLALSSTLKLQNKSGINPISHVTIITLTTAAQILLNQSEILNIILECTRKNSPHTHVSIGAIIAVIAPKALLEESATHTDW